MSENEIQQPTENEEFEPPPPGEGYVYKRPKADQALVRTGGKRAKVVIGEGIWYNPDIHEIKEISLNTMDLTVTREQQDALITFDFNRADIECVFYVRVQAEEESVLQAAQSLGDKSMTPETLTELLEPKLDGTLRAVAAQIEITDLVQKRQEFADGVQDAIGENLLEDNGLILENVGIITVNQTPVESLDPENQFDAQGVRTITAITTAMKVETEQLKIDQEVAIQKINVNAEKQKLELKQDLAYKQAEQQRNIITFSAEQEADTNKFQYEMDQGVQEREYEMKREVEKARIEQEQVIQQRAIEKNAAVQIMQIAQTRQIQITQAKEKKRETKLAIFPLTYAKVNEISDVVSSFLTEHAIIAVYESGNALVIRDIEGCVNDAEFIIGKLDVPQATG